MVREGGGREQARLTTPTNRSLTDPTWKALRNKEALEALGLTTATLTALLAGVGFVACSTHAQADTDPRATARPDHRRERIRLAPDAHLACAVHRTRPRRSAEAGYCVIGPTRLVDGLWRSRSIAA